MSRVLLNKLKPSEEQALPPLLILAIILYTIIFSIYSILKYYGFRAYGMDLGVYAQALWTTLHGRFFYETPDLYWNPGGSFFGVHFAPLMFLLLPIYAILPRPETLLVLQSFVLGLGALPLYWIARDITSSTEKAIIVALWYLSYAPLHGVNLYDFHLEAFLPALFLFSYWFFYSKKWVKYLFSVFLVTFTIDYASLILLFFAIYWLIYYRSDLLKTFTKRRAENKGALFMALLTLVLSILTFALAFKTIEIFGPEPLTTSPLWPHLGTKFSDIVLGLLDPGKVLAALSYDYWYKLAYVSVIFAPVLFLNFMSLLPMIMTIPWFAISLLSTNPTFYSLGWQYVANIVPFIFLAVVFSCQSIDLKKLRKYFVIGFIISLLLTPINPITQHQPLGAAYMPPILNEHTKLLHEIIRLIPENATITTQNNIFPHLVQKGLVYLWLPQGVLPEFILLDITFPEILHKYGGKTAIDIANELLGKAHYGVYCMADGIVLYKLGYTGPPLIYLPYFTKLDYKNFIIESGEIVPFQHGEYVLKSIPTNSPNTFFYGPYMPIYPGTYEATFTLMIIGDDLKPGDNVITLDIVADKGREKLAELPIFYGIDITATKSWSNITLKFPINRFYSDVEFRGRNVANNAVIFLKEVSVKQVSYNIELILHTRFDYRSLVVDKGAVINGAIVHKEGAGVFWYGPYAKLPPGKYEVTYWMKLDNATVEHVIDLDVAYSKGTVVLNRTSLHIKNFVIGEYKPFTLMFTLNESISDVEFRGVNVENNVSLSLLFIDIKYLGEDYEASNNN
jgi:uncharacterized membrane protein